jgi:Flp pilus assembly protein TadG
MAALRGLIKDNRGQALVELAMTLPILLMLLFGIVEFGRIFNAYLVVNNAAREGARVAAVGYANEEIISTVNKAAAIFDARDLDIQIDPENSREQGKEVVVSVSYSVDIFAPIISAIIPDPFEVAGTSVMRVE